MAISQLQNGALTALRSINTPGKAALVAGGGVALGAYAAGQRGSVPGQTVAYAGTLGALAAIPVFLIGKGAMGVATRNANQLLKSGVIDDAAHAARLVEARTRTSAPARNLAMGFGGIAAGSTVVNMVAPNIERSAIDSYVENLDKAKPAQKSASDSND